MKNQMSVQVGQYLQASLSDNTRRAYTHDLAHFKAWGGRIPASPETVATYLAEHAQQLSIATLRRRVVSIGRAHTLKRLSSPAHAALVRATLQGIRRTYGSAQRQVKPALLNDVKAMVSGLREMKGVRDRALLLVGFAGGFRRAELVSIRVKDVRFVEEGAVIHLRRGKTDQVGVGREIAIPFMGGKFCPVKAMREWLDCAQIDDGYLFRRVSRFGQVLEGGLSAQSVSLIVKQRAALVGLDAQQYSGHSLRSGLVTSAAKSGVSSWQICRQTGHQSETVMRRYIRDSDLFGGNALGQIW